MKIETLEIAGFRSALEALRLPYGLECRSKTMFEKDYCAPELDEYCTGEDELLRLHSEVVIKPKDMQLMSTLVKRGPEHAKVLRGINVWAKITAPIYIWAEIETYTVGHTRLASESTMHIDCKGLSGDELVKAKSKIPMGKELTKVDMFNYQSLRNIYYQRKDHRLPEWYEFCKWIETLPFIQQLILCQ